MYFLRAGSCLLGGAMLFACAGEEPIIEASRDCAPIYGSEICSWSQTQDGVLVAVGADIPLTIVEGAPAELPPGPFAPAAVANYPASVGAEGGLRELTFYWEPHGHPPGAYLTPHFDFHFYLTGGAERSAIDCVDTSLPAEVPEGYATIDLELPPEMAEMIGMSTLIAMCVPGMGMHYVLSGELESSDLFGGTMVVGYYGGQPLFIEPMISKGMLMERASFDLPIPEIPGLTGPHPTMFRADYDSEADSYRFVYSDFTGSASGE